MTIQIPDEKRSATPVELTHWIKVDVVPDLDLQANASCNGVTELDATATGRVIEQRSAVERISSELATLNSEYNELRQNRGEKLIAGADCREIDKRLRQIQDHETRLQDELAARQRNLRELERESAKVHLEFVRTRRDAFAGIVTSLGDDAQHARVEWGIRLAIYEAARKRLDQYDEGLRISQQRCAEICAPPEGVSCPV